MSKSKSINTSKVCITTVIPWLGTGNLLCRQNIVLIIIIIIKNKAADLIYAISISHRNMWSCLGSPEWSSSRLCFILPYVLVGKSLLRLPKMPNTFVKSTPFIQRFSLRPIHTVSDTTSAAENKIIINKNSFQSNSSYTYFMFLYSISR